MLRTIPIEVPAEVAAGEPLDVKWLDKLTVQVGGTFTAEIQLEGRLTPVNDWIAIGDPITEPGIVVIEQLIAELRATTTAYTDGTPTAIVGGRVS